MNSNQPLGFMAYSRSPRKMIRVAMAHPETGFKVVIKAYDRESVDRNIKFYEKKGYEKVGVI